MLAFVRLPNLVYHLNSESIIPHQKNRDVGAPFHQLTMDAITQQKCLKDLILLDELY
jgi:hypothetical protein